MGFDARAMFKYNIKYVGSRAKSSIKIFSTRVYHFAGVLRANNQMSKINDVIFLSIWFSTNKFFIYSENKKKYNYTWCPWNRNSKFHTKTEDLCRKCICKIRQEITHLFQLNINHFEKLWRSLNRSVFIIKQWFMDLSFLRNHWINMTEFISPCNGETCQGVKQNVKFASLKNDKASSLVINKTWIFLQTFFNHGIGYFRIMSKS